MRRSTWLGLLAIGLGSTGCAGRKPAAKTAAAADTVTTRQRQEAIGRSGIPGASAINKALEVSDSAASRAARLDSIH